MRPSLAYTPAATSLSSLEVDAVLDVCLGEDDLFSKPCGCGRVHDAEAWASLPPAGEMRDEEENLELRTCVCGSTLAVPLCIVEGCGDRGEWVREDSLASYCLDHIDEWLLAEESIARRGDL
jgi:hypothetical protein